MVQINVADKEVSLNIIYYGIREAGKKTSLQWLYQQIPSSRRSALRKIEVGGETVYSFDYFPENFQVAGMKVKCLLHTVSLPILRTNPTRTFFQHLDGVVFVGDSRESCESGNSEAFAALKDFLDELGYKPKDTPLVFQWNKNDLDAVKSPDSWDSLLNEAAAPSISTCASKGEGIMETVDTVLQKVKKKVQLQLVASTGKLPGKLKLGVLAKFKEEKSGESEESKSEEKPVKIKLPKKWRQKKEDDKSKSSTKKEKAAKIKLKTLLKETEPTMEAATDDQMQLAPKDEVKVPEKDSEKLDQVKVPEKDSGQPDVIKPSTPEPMPQEPELPQAKLAGEDTEPDLGIAPSASKTEPAKKLPVVPSKKPKAYKTAPASSDKSEVIKLLQAGKPLEKIKLHLLDLSDETFDKPIRISKCDIGNVLMDGAEFKAAVTIENSTIQQSFILGKKDPAIFRDSFTLKRTDVNGEIHGERVLFVKKLILSDCQLERPVNFQEIVCENGVTIVNCEFVGETIFRGIQCRGAVNISASKFGNILGFENGDIDGAFIASSTQFNRGHFMRTAFGARIEFLNCTFEKSGNLSNIDCQQGLLMEGCVFNGPTSFSQAHLRGYNYCRRTEFFHDSCFSKILFAGEIIFEKVTFGANTDFTGATFQTIQFLQTIFEGVTNFQDAVFSGSLNCLESDFKKRVQFSHAIFLQKADFRNSLFSGVVAFSNLTSDYILLSRKQITKKLCADQEKDYATAEQEYLTLKHIFERQGLHQDSDWAHYHARRAARKKLSIFPFHPVQMLRKFASWFFLDLGCGYGTRPFNVVLLSFLLIMIFAAGYLAMSMSAWPLPGQPPAITAWDKWAGPFILSLKSFLPTGIGNWDISRADAANYRIWLPKLVMLLENTLGLFMLFLFSMTFFRKLLQN